MFDLEEALRYLNGRDLSFEELRTELTRIRQEHFGELPPEVGVGDLIRLGRRYDLIVEDTQGRMHISTGVEMH